MMKEVWRFTLFRLPALWALTYQLCSCSSQKPLSDQNLAHLYARNTPVSCDFAVVAAPEEFRVFCSFSFIRPEADASGPGFWEKYRLEYQLRPSYESRRCLLRDSLGPGNFIRSGGRNQVFQLTVPRKEDSPEQVLLLKLLPRNAAEEYLFCCRIPAGLDGYSSPFALFKGNGRVPVPGNMARAGDTLCIRSFDFRKNEIRVAFIPFSGQVAMPPMATVPLLDSSKDQNYPVSVKLNEPLVFREPGYYRVSDLNESTGFGFVVGEAEFPAITRAEELVAPLIYISSREERKTLFQHVNPKLAVDDFWLKISPLKDRARELISRYYLNIEEANRRFTCHKEGWKTDRGMVMAIFGPPAQLFRSQDLEIWVYDKSQNPESAVFYFFRKRAANFADIWELKRLPDYDKIWYGVVDLWRKGIIDR